MIVPPLDADRLYRAIPSRFSSREYVAEPVDTTALEAFHEQSALLFDDARAIFVREVPEGFFKGIVGSYFRIDNAPSAFVLVVKIDAPDALWHMGYLGEALVLEATSHGIDSCWVAGSFSRTIAAQTVTLASDERIVAAIALGKGTKPQPERKRKRIEVIAPGWERWPLWAKRGVRAAHEAPSAVNRQPWRFSFTQEAGDVRLDQRGAMRFVSASQELDCGIAALHFELGAASANVFGIWRKEPASALFFEPASPIFSSAAIKAGMKASFPASPAGSFSASSELDAGSPQNL